MFVFRLMGAKSADGPFTTLIEMNLPDSRKQSPVPSLRFLLTPAEVQFVRFEVHAFWGVGGGLQFIEVLGNFNN